MAQALSPRRHYGSLQSFVKTSAHRHQEIVRLRRPRRTYRQISRQLGVSQSTVGRVLQKLGLNRLSALEPAQPVNRYQHEHPGDLLHLDIKKPGCFKRPGHRVTGHRRLSGGTGWEYVHVTIDDASRIAFSSVHADETGRSACLALLSALLPQPWDHRTSSADGQRLMLQVASLPSTVRASWNHPQAHQTLHAACQRQGRAVQPDCVA